MSERCPPALAAKLAALADQSLTQGFLALDEGIDPDERTPDALSDRLAFHISPEGRKPSVPAGTPTLALKTARAHAKLMGRNYLTDIDISTALVYPHRATVVPQEEAPQDDTPPPPP